MGKEAIEVQVRTTNDWFGRFAAVAARLECMDTKSRSCPTFARAAPDLRIATKRPKA